VLHVALTAIPRLWFWSPLEPILPVVLIIIFSALEKSNGQGNNIQDALLQYNQYWSIQ